MRARRCGSVKYGECVKKKRVFAAGALLSSASHSSSSTARAREETRTSTQNLYRAERALATS